MMRWRQGPTYFATTLVNPNWRIPFQGTTAIRILAASMDAIRTVVIIPTYNNDQTIAGVVHAVRGFVPDIIVVNDGSTDNTAERLAEIEDIEIITCMRNRGKGAALRAGFESASERGFTHAITMDADGQHMPEDIPSFLEALEREPETLWIGNRTLATSGVAQPARSRFGARFGAFWYRCHTGLRIDDTQCGLRCYPLARVVPLRCRTNRYEYEIQILIKAAWAGIPVRQIPIHLHYQPKKERVSHFRPIRDFFRISVVNARAAMTRILMPWLFLDAPGTTAMAKIRYLIWKELTSHHSPSRAAAALALGSCIGLMPIHGFQVLLAMGLSVLLRLNRALAFLGVAISSPPLLPFWIAAGYGLGTVVLPTETVQALALHVGRHGLAWLADLFSTESASSAALTGFVQWFAGSIVMALAVGMLVYAIAFPFFVWFSKVRLHRAG